MRRMLYAVIILACLLAPALTAFATEPYGIGLWPDGLTYVLTAQGIAQGKGAMILGEYPLLSWPPFYPFLIAAVQQLSTTDSMAAARLLNLFLYPIIVALTAFLLKQYADNLTVAAFSAIAIALFFPVFKVSLWAMSEMPFIALTVCLFVAINAYVVQPTFRRLIILALLTALLCLTRYIGIVAFGTTALFLLIFHRRRNAFTSHILRIAAYSTISLLPLIIWAAHNFMLNDTLFFARPAPIETLATSLMRIATVLTVWLITPFATQSMLALAVITAFLAYVAALLRRYLRFFLVKMTQKQTWFFLYILLFTFSYLVFITTASATSAFEPLNERLLAPLSISLLLLALQIGLVLFELLWAKGERQIYALLLATFTWVIYSGISSFSLASQARAEGLGYYSEFWRKNTLLASLIEFDDLENCELYSNEPNAIYLFLNRSSHLTLNKTYYGSAEIANLLNDSWLLGTEGCVVWFAGVKHNFLYTLEELKTTAEFTPLIELGSGGVYKVRKRAEP
ncbi:MAG: hypothetical protein CUN51_06280 [Candidatus Thermofonsia Clade 1 bacterium]|uniref:Uncharacterized protein n=1 Tax=Candidatus Thermofonsia Clade 1 bacterium TaxID=2364210 RepID=A0A2M8NZR2_9CHLR|nr:MAG: hypothetical protein CUN51_06280 [Candidatus Thermofonsia Clade 1 bacterium]